MPWVRLDDGFAEHPKLDAVGPAAAWLHVAALCWSARTLSDGIVSHGQALRLTSIPKPKNAIDRLISAGIWHESGRRCDSPFCPSPAPVGCYAIHDYHEYQPTRESVLDQREKDADRQRRHRAEKAKSRRDSQRDSRPGHGVSHGPVTPAPTRPVPEPLVVDTTSVLSRVDVPDGSRDLGVVTHAIEILADADMANAKSAGKRIGNETAYLASCITSRARTDTARLTALAEQDPDANAFDLVDRLGPDTYLD